MNLQEKIINIYPELVAYKFLDSNILLQNDSDGKGDYIAKWEHLEFAQPTQAELDAV
jgi:XkdW protein